MTSVVQHITFGCTDPHEPYELAEFWSEVLGTEVDAMDAPGDDTVALARAAGAPALLFVRATEKKAERNGVLLSLRPKGTRVEEVRRLTGLGATVLADPADSAWVLLADPAGNEFRVGAGERDWEGGEFPLRALEERLPQLPASNVSASNVSVPNAPVPNAPVPNLPVPGTPAPPASAPPAPVPNAVVLRRTDEGYPGVQGGTFTQGVSAETVDTRALCLHEVRIPPHTRGEPHVHAGHESAIYIISGRHEIHHGADLSVTDEIGPGDMVFIPADTPHMPVTGDEPVHCIVARTDPREQESVHLLADLPRG
ncbi:VOC family protein [Streptomyces sp. NPDC058657]|uniref:VOC family protein n=1 Tax=unclassified Streptomyces TaxID=2593676 RepID=UPI0036589245